MSLCIVSAFFDIGRGEWDTFTRSTEQYINNFRPYVGLGHNMVVFIDNRHVKTMEDVIETGGESSGRIKLVPISRKWMMDNIYAYKQLAREKEIMESDKFKKLTMHRRSHPECSKPEYNIIQHAKIDFVAYVINNRLSESDYFAWSDFGYFQHPSRIPRSSLDINKFDLERVNFQAISELSERDFNVPYTLIYAPERIGGFFYLGNAKNLLKYQELYHKICKEFHKLGIVDDDQHIMIQSIAREPSLFKVWNLGGWHLVYNHFQSNLPN